MIWKIHLNELNIFALLLKLVTTKRFIYMLISDLPF
jgi:hypothetical protein